ncbi:hypothetical protein Slin15195_G127400 [Septoria linicola]|uniref:Uncharacterized protein n=1 Tax=Septoria linicola TaxID=215465 RepID=A0A9Q9B9A6_9PEZI|nr:hypothetical protein Slin14017_G083580 [Septoria linicola]USW59421.1 hypothetical protein Slin15195_G127400 [Septoria linicola]
MAAALLIGLHSFTPELLTHIAREYVEVYGPHTRVRVERFANFAAIAASRLPAIINNHVLAVEVERALLLACEFRIDTAMPFSQQPAPDPLRHTRNVLLNMVGQDRQTVQLIRSVAITRHALKVIVRDGRVNEIQSGEQHLGDHIVRTLDFLHSKCVIKIKDSVAVVRMRPQWGFFNGRWGARWIARDAVNLRHFYRKIAYTKYDAIRGRGFEVLWTLP